MRRSTILVGFITCVIGAGLFQLKYEVMRLESEYKGVCHSIQASQEAISILKAEWAHLTSPERLQRLAAKHLGVKQVSHKQLISLRQTPVIPRGNSSVQEIRAQRVESDVEGILAELMEDSEGQLPDGPQGSEGVVQTSQTRAIDLQ